MILYKYTSLETAQKIVASKQLGFSRARYLNDPLDRPNPLPVDTSDDASALLASVGAKVKGHIWEKTTGLLCLSRTPNSAVMWSHYADSHRGAVVEVDASAAGFVDPDRNLIPAQYGTVVYTRTPQREYSPSLDGRIRLGSTHNFVPGQYEKLQQLFLTKDLAWAYEEEVRVAKCLDGIKNRGRSVTESGDWAIVKAATQPEVHCCKVPPDAIRKIIVGVQSDVERMRKWSKTTDTPIFVMGRDQLNRQFEPRAIRDYTP